MPWPGDHLSVRFEIACRLVVDHSNTHNVVWFVSKRRLHKACSSGHHDQYSERSAGQLVSAANFSSPVSGAFLRYRFERPLG